jgi:hypothetical protein
MKYRIDPKNKEILLDRPIPVQELIDEVARGSLLEYTICPGGSGFEEASVEEMAEAWDKYKKSQIK